MKDVVVIGADLAGLTTVIKVVDTGLSVTLVTKGVGGIQLGMGTVGILGYRLESVEAPLEALEGHVVSRPTHPYSHVIPDFAGAPVAWLRDSVGADAPIGDETRNVRIPTGVGALRPTCLIPPSMEAGIPQAGARYTIVGLTRFEDLYLGPVTKNLTHQNDLDGVPINARTLSVDYVVCEGEVNLTGTNHACSLDHEENRTCLTDQIRPLLRDGEIVGLPAVLGLDGPNVWRDLADKLGHPVFEVPIQSLSVPGMRLSTLLTCVASDKHRVIPGSPIEVMHTADGRVNAIEYASVGRSAIVGTRSLISAADGFEPGAFDMDSYGTVRETICGLSAMGVSGQLLHADLWDEGQPLSLAGLAVDDNMRALNEEGAPVCPNLYVARGNPAGVTRWRKKSGEGIALVSVLAAIDSIVEELKWPWKCRC